MGRLMPTGGDGECTRIPGLAEALCNARHADFSPQEPDMFPGVRSACTRSDPARSGGMNPAFRLRAAQTLPLRGRVSRRARPGR